MKVINAKNHAVIDYIHAGSFLVAAALFRDRNPRASNASFALGLGVLTNALMTDYPLGVFRAYSFKTHGILDYGVAALCTALPNMLGIEGTPESMFFRGQGIGETGIAAITDYSDNTGARHLGTYESDEAWFERQAAA
jgi:hypothetical protein